MDIKERHDAHPRMALAMSKAVVWSETFIAAHVERLRDVRLVLSDGLPPRCADNVPLLLPSGPWSRFMSLIERRVVRRPEADRLLQATVNVLNERRIQVVLCEYGNMGEAMLEACKRAGVPLVAHFHGYDAYVDDVLVRMDNYRRLFADASALVVVSRAMKDQLVRLGAPETKIHHICYGIDVDHFSGGDPASSPPHFLAVGRFVDKKAPHLTIMAFSKVAALHPDARLTMVGQGVLWESCTQLVRALGIEDQVDLCGVRTPDQIAALFRTARAFVQHSVTTTVNDHEGTPLAVLEAMASGVPVIATEHAGIPDVVEHGMTGLLCAERDVEAMAGNMLRLVNDPVEAGEMGRRARAFVERYHRVEDRIGQLQGLLDSLSRR